MPAVSERSQVALIWVALAGGLIWLITMGALLREFPPPNASDSATTVAAWYQAHATGIRIGATIASLTSGFLVPFWMVIAIQISRLEFGHPIWTLMTAAGGALMSIFLVAPPLFWGVAAFDPGRSADATALMHQLGVLTFMSTTQYFIIGYAAVTIMCFMPQRANHSPFPRWLGYFSAWSILFFEAGALCFNFTTGPFAWNGLFVFWIPITLFAVWTGVMAYLLLINLQRQRLEISHPAERPAIPTR